MCSKNVVGSQEAHINVPVILSASRAPRGKDDYSISQLATDAAKANRVILVEKSNRGLEFRAGVADKFGTRVVYIEREPAQVQAETARAPECEDASFRADPDSGTETLRPRHTRGQRYTLNIVRWVIEPR